MTLEVAELGSVSAQHEALIEKGIITKSFVNMADVCELQLGLYAGLVTGQQEKRPPGFAMAQGLTLHDLLNLWSMRTLNQELLTPEEARQILSERWDKRVPQCADAPPPSRKDDKIDRLMILFSDWRTMQEKVQKTYGPLLGSEVNFGDDGNVKLGGIPISSRIDMLYAKAPLDAKVTGKSSPYRTKVIFNYELAHQSVATGRSKAAFVPMVHDAWKDPKDDATNRITIVEQELTPAILQLAVDRLDRFMALYEAAKKNPRVLQPAGKIGTFPCHPKWCGYFGTVCPHTKHLKREDFL